MAEHLRIVVASTRGGFYIGSDGVAHGRTIESMTCIDIALKLVEQAPRKSCPPEPTTSGQPQGVSVSCAVCQIMKSLACGVT